MQNEFGGKDEILYEKDISIPPEYVQLDYIQHEEIKISNYHYFRFLKPDSKDLIGLYMAQELPQEGKKLEVELHNNNGMIKGYPLLLPDINVSVVANEDNWICSLLGEDLEEEDI